MKDRWRILFGDHPVPRVGRSLMIMAMAYRLQEKYRAVLSHRLFLACTSFVVLATSLGITSALGRSGLLPAAVAAWVPNFMFSMIAISIFLFGEER